MKVIVLDENSKLDMFDKFVTSAVQSKFGKNIIVVGSMGKEYQLYGDGSDKPDDYEEPNDIDINLYRMIDKSKLTLEKFIDEVIEDFNRKYNFDFIRNGDIRITAGDEINVKKSVGILVDKKDSKIKIDIHLKLQDETDIETHTTYQGEPVTTLAKAIPMAVAIKHLVSTDIQQAYKEGNSSGREKYFKTLYDYIRKYDVPMPIMIKALSKSIKYNPDKNKANFYNNFKGLKSYYSAYQSESWFNLAFERIKNFILPIIVDKIDIKQDTRIWNSHEFKWFETNNETYYKFLNSIVKK